jgi:YVTN family beta-propeller protein
VVTPDGALLLTANRGSNTVSLINAGSRFEVVRLQVPSSPTAITLDRNGRRAFVFGPLMNGVTVIDVAGRSLSRTIVTDPGPVRGQLNRRGDRLYVIHDTSPYVTVVNPATLTVTGRFPVRFPMDTLQVDPGTDFVYLGGRRTFAVALYDPLSFAVIDTVGDSGGTVNMTTDVEDNTLYLVIESLNRVRVHERIRKRRVGELDVGDGPTWISVMGES